MVCGRALGETTITTPPFNHPHHYHIHKHISFFVCLLYFPYFITLTIFISIYTLNILKRKNLLKII